MFSNLAKQHHIVKKKTSLALTRFSIGWFSFSTGYNKDHIVSMGITENPPNVGVNAL